MDGRADVGEPVLLLRVHAHVVGGFVVGGSNRSSVRPSFASTSSRMPSGPRSSTMNFIRAFTREMR